MDLLTNLPPRLMAQASAPQAATGGPPRTLMMCLGTRPEIIKMAPVCQALHRSGIPLRLLHTGQHEELAWPLYDFFDLRPDAQIRLAREDNSLASLSAELLKQVDRTLVQWSPAALLVHGDTSSAAMGALAAFYRHIPVAHVEAGLRSHRSDDPFPEEFNRSLIARVATWHFAPTRAAVGNLRREGIADDRTYLVGNTIVDATRSVLERLEQGNEATGEDPGIEERLLLVTAHRRENWGTPLAGFVRAIGALLAAHPQARAIWTLHANPAVASLVRKVHAELPQAIGARFALVPPLDYPEMIRLLKRAWLVLTDSGGIQEEACALGAPVLVLRTSTERPELLETGAGRLVGCDPFRIVEEVDWLWKHPEAYEAMRAAENPFGDGQSSARIASILGQWLANRGAEPGPDAPDAQTRHGASTEVQAPTSIHARRWSA